MSEHEKENTTLRFLKGEESPALTASLIAECERRNQANPELVKINHNTWIKREEN